MAAFISLASDFSTRSAALVLMDTNSSCASLSELAKGHLPSRLVRPIFIDGGDSGSTVDTWLTSNVWLVVSPLRRVILHCALLPFTNIFAFDLALANLPLLFSSSSLPYTSLRLLDFFLAESS